MSGTMGSSLWGLVVKSDAMSKFILVSLLFVSIVCWSIIFYKMILLSVKRKQLDTVMRKMRSLTSFDQLVLLTHAEEKTYPGHLLIEQLGEAKYLLKKGNKRSLSLYDLQLLEDHRSALVEEMIYVENSYLSVLSGSAAVAPLCGLLGTVWGLMHSFVSISFKQSADIVTIAPGIAEALLTTTAGLLVAIPALSMYGYLRAQVNSVEYQLVVLSDMTHKIIRQTLSDVRETNETSMASEKTNQQGTIAS